MDHADALGRLAEIAAELGAAHLEADARALAARVAEGRFYVACIGQFKRGKSTLLNALVGHPILPAAILPVTAVPTVLRYGAEISARVRFTNGSTVDIDASEIEPYVSEEQNPENTKAVELVEVFVPSTLLAGGMCLVDTPGVGSVFVNNTATTQAFIPHIDTALLVVGADPPISGDELALAEQVGRLVQHIVVVLNKADRFADTERADAIAFTDRILSQRLHRPVAPIYAVSATEHLRGEGPARDWPALEAALRALAEGAGQGIVQAATRRGVARIVGACLRQIQMELRALREPIEESARRVAELRARISGVEFQLPRLGALIAIEQQQIAKRLSGRRETFLATTIPDARIELRTRMPGSSSSSGMSVQSLREQAFALARHVAQERLGPWFTDEERFAEQLYRETVARFVDLAKMLLVQVEAEVDAEVDADVGTTRQTSQSLVQSAPDVLDSELALADVSRFYFHDVESLVRSASPWPRIVDSLRSRAAVRRGAERRASWYLEQLLQINSTRVHNDIDDRVADSGRRLEAEVRQLLQQLLASAERALQRATLARSEGAARVTDDIRRLEAASKEVDSIRASSADIPEQWYACQSGLIHEDADAPVDSPVLGR